MPVYLRHSCCFANDTLLVWWFSGGGPTFRVVYRVGPKQPHIKATVRNSSLWIGGIPGPL